MLRSARVPEEVARARDGVRSMSGQALRRALAAQEALLVGSVAARLPDGGARVRAKIDELRAEAARREMAGEANAKAEAAARPVTSAETMAKAVEQYREGDSLLKFRKRPPTAVLAEDEAAELIRRVAELDLAGSSSSAARWTGEYNFDDEAAT